MKKFSRNTISILLLTVYALMIFAGPAAAAGSIVATSRAAAECRGDCRLCGCSPERSASRTCCCWMRKAKKAPSPEIICGCCNKKQPRKTVTLRGYCPCGGNGEEISCVANQSEHLPYLYDECKFLFCENELYSFPIAAASEGDKDPPDPPPKLAGKLRPLLIH